MKSSNIVISKLNKPFTLSYPKVNNDESIRSPIKQVQDIEIKDKDDLFYNVFYTKDLKKKKKSYSDGILQIMFNKVKLYDIQGDEVYSTFRGKLFKELPKENEEYFLGSYLIEIQSILNTNEFRSGRCFMQKSTTQIEPVGIFKKPNILLKKPLHVVGKTISADNAVRKIEIPEDVYMLTDQTKEDLIPIYIDQFLSEQMRPHQKEGVKFMFECVCGFKGPEINGCILADSMGLGKSLQTIALIWTLIKKNPFNKSKPYLSKVIIVAPLTLIKNWEKEFSKWLGLSRLQPLIALGSKEEVRSSINQFKESYFRCLIISYETFKIHSEILNDSCDMVIFDEGHRLKNMNLKTFQCFSKFKCKHRIILTGTPLQNCMDELYACCDLINPGIFTNLTTFKKVFAQPIIDGLKKGIDDNTRLVAKERSKELSKMLSKFILRRPASILEKLLPSKTEYLLYIRMSSIQAEIYKSIINLMKSKTDLSSSTTFSCILTLRKLLNHPNLLMKDENEFSHCAIGYFPENLHTIPMWETSIKFRFVFDILKKLEKSEKIVIVSYFTQMLDLIELIVKETKLQFLRLDGKVDPKKRQRLVDRFNDHTTAIKVFLLCAKAGGTGLNLTGGNKMILMEPDWNPSNEHQVMGRIWRDGQKKPVHIYRLISCGTLEERIIQRQILKEDLSDNVVDEKNIQSIFDSSELKKIFKFKNDKECLSFSIEENEKEIVFNENNDFDASMSEYILYVKKKVKTLNNGGQEKENHNDDAISNIFLEENIFLTPKKEEKLDESDINEEDNNDDYSEEEKDDNDYQNDDNEEINNENKNMAISNKELEKDSKEEPFEDPNIKKIERNTDIQDTNKAKIQKSVLQNQKFSLHNPEVEVSAKIVENNLNYDSPKNQIKSYSRVNIGFQGLLEQRKTENEAIENSVANKKRLSDQKLSHDVLKKMKLL